MSHFCADVRMIHNSGIGVYIKQYIAYILREELYSTVTLIGKGKDLNQYFGEYKNWRHIEADFPIYSIKEQIKLPKLIPNCDVFWSPHYNIPLIVIKAKKRLVTVPDVFHLAHLNTLSLSQKIYAKLVTNAAIYQSDRVITISEFSSKEIIRLTEVSKDKVGTVLLGLDKNLFSRINDQDIWQRVRSKYSLPQRYILFVGNVKPNKNLRMLVEAFAQITDHIPDCHLLIAGKKDGFITGDADLFKRINEDEKLAKRVAFSGYVDLEDLPVLYSMASVFAFPSLYEGFGFPPLEAMACGCPVVASNRTSIPEICGDAAYYVDPVNSKDIARGIREVLTNLSLSSKLISAGLQQVQQYDWLESQKQFVKEINRLLPFN